jgi:hypothetical protein
MMVFGVSALTYAASSDRVVCSRLTEANVTSVPAGTSTGAAPSAAPIPVASQVVFSFPHSNRVPSVQMQCKITVTLPRRAANAA